MGIFSKLFGAVEADVHRVFEQSKRESVKAAAAVQAARDTLTRELNRAQELAEQTRTSAEAAANHAAEQARQLAIEARAAAEAVENHRALLAAHDQRQEPKL